MSPETVTAFRCCGCVAATMKPVMPPYEWPRMPTSPLDHGWFGIQLSMISLPSSAERHEKRSNSPLEQPVPRTDACTVT